MYHTYVNYMQEMVFEYIYKAVCRDGCFNGGECTAPGTCTCFSGWTGNDCTQGKKWKSY